MPRWLPLAVLLAACSGGDDGPSPDGSGDDDDDATELTPWSEVVTTQDGGCCRTVSEQFEWTDVDHEGFHAVWAMPDDPVGALVVFHGTNGGVAAVQQAEWVEIYNLLYPRGIGVIITISEDRDGKQWDLTPMPDNVDYPRVQSLLARVADETDFATDLPLVPMGFSQGCGMVELMGSQGRDAGQNVAGMVFHNCGQGAADDLPALYVDAENDSAATRMAGLAGDHPDGTLLEGTEIPLHPNRFAKLNSFSVDESARLFDALVDLEVIDSDGNRTVDLGEDPETVVVGIENALQVQYAADVVQQLRVVWSLHRVSAQNKLAEAAWIEDVVRAP